jgi:hypothetical protein
MTLCLDIQHVVFVDKTRTADFQTTFGLIKLIKNQANRDDILAFFEERYLPFTGQVALDLATEVLRHPPAVGHLTTTATQKWPSAYSRFIKNAA